MLAGDTPLEGILKELQEEIFYNAQLPDLHLTELFTFFNHDLPNNNEFLTLYEIVYPGPFSISPHEVEEPLQWAECESLYKAMEETPEKFSPAFHNIIREYRAFIAR